MSKAAFAKRKGVPRTTFIAILSLKDKIESSLRVQDGEKRKRMRVSTFEDVENALVKWFRMARAQNIPISGLILKEKALQFANELGVSEFSASNGWFERFKERHGLSFKKMCGEAAAVDMRPVEEWKNGLLKDVLQRYNPCDVFNLDETGLFFQLVPDKTLTFQSEDCSGGKKSKQRVTVLLGANMDGSEKLKPLVIGKTAKPRCFKNVKSLSVSYEANSKSWMTSNVWEKTLKEFDKKFHATNRKVAFVVDNCTAHTEVRNLQSVELVYMPPNATSVLQPLDQGIISSFKRHYRKHLVRDWIKAIDEGREWKPNLLDGINYIHKSWADVTDKTIKNCFRHAGFVESPSSSEDVNDDEDDYVPLSELLRQLKERNKDVMDEETYLGIDQNLVTSPELTVSEIANEIRERHVPASEESESEDEVEVPPSKNEALQCIEVLRKYFSSISGTEEDLNSVYKLEKRIMLSNPHTKQTRIDGFFIPK